MEYFIEKVESFYFIGIPVRTTNEGGEAERAIARHWQSFFADNILQKIPNRLDDQILGVYTEYDKGENSPYTFAIGCVVEQNTATPEGFISLQVPEAVYAVFSVKGDFPYSLIDTWKKIWNSSLTRKYTTDFEVYGEKFQSNEPELDVYIAINAPISSQEGAK